MREQARADGQSIVIVFQLHLPVQLLNVSRSGCLLQVSRPVRVGALGRLRVALDETEYADDVRVARCAALPGEVCALGVELLWVPRLQPRSPESDAPSLALRLRATAEEPRRRDVHGD